MNAATEDGTGQSPVVLTTQVARLYEHEGDRRAAAIPLGLYVRRYFDVAPREMGASSRKAVPYRHPYRER